MSVSAPNAWLRLAETRACFELGAFVAASPLLRAPCLPSIRRAAPHPVLVLPGFTAGDLSTLPLRRVLIRQGYATYGWGLGQNFGPTERVIDGIHGRLDQLARQHDGPVSLIGWSLGGVYARELARDSPSVVRQVITLGSPFRMTPADRSSVSGLFDRFGGYGYRRFAAQALRLAVHEYERLPLSVPSTAIYTRTDGIVRWHTCIDTESPRHENIEVRGSHSGLGFNPAVVIAISDRLAQPVDEWCRFTAPRLLAHLFPRPASWTDSAA